MKSTLFILGDATEQGGIEKVTLNLADELSTHVNVEVLSLYKKNQDISFVVNNLKVDFINNGFEISMYNRNLPLLKGMIFDIIYILKKSICVRTYLNKRRVERIVVPDIKTLLLIVISTLGLNIKLVSVEHFEYNVPNKVIKILRKLLYKLMRIKVIIQTDEDYDKYKFAGESKIKIIPNMVSIQRNTGIKQKNKVIAVGRYCHQKGFDLLIDSWALIPEEKRENWCLDIYGQGEDEKKLLDQIDALKVKNVNLLPYTKNIDDVYEGAKIFVLSSRFEGLGMVLIEALAHELSCISFACPAGPKTIIKHNHNGLLIEECNTRELAKGIELLLQDDKLRSFFSSNAISSVEQFSKKSVTEKWIKVINET